MAASSLQVRLERLAAIQARLLDLAATLVKPGGRLSLQKHHHRSEHWIVVRGTAQVTVNELVKTVHENESIYLPIGSVHRLANPGKIPLELIEVQVGSYLGEDDIVRLDDVVGHGLVRAVCVDDRSQLGRPSPGRRGTRSRARGTAADFLAARPCRGQSTAKQ